MRACAAVAEIAQQPLDDAGIRTEEAPALDGLVSAQQQSLDNAYSFDTVGPPASLAQRRAYWLDDAAGGLFAGSWEDSAPQIAKFYERFGVGLLGLHHVVGWEDGLVPPPVRTFHCRNGVRSAARSRCPGTTLICRAAPRALKRWRNVALIAYSLRWLDAIRHHEVFLRYPFWSRFKSNLNHLGRHAI